jgi:hypothetical protein
LPQPQGFDAFKPSRATAAHLHVAGIGRQQALQDGDGRRLAGAVRPEQAEASAAVDLEVEMVDGEDVSVLLLESPALESGAV